ncbi:UDP-4-amino-4, 6-dideoxy-N-acetyl-beta-L-altrosamine transaminase [Vibrio cholerae]|uniref:DegT/DnrJ/EryC1/StrS family aminotransferase n=1 Tax=Vibrio cholerae TaxID=666 RepID=UPI0011D80C4B|nr:DegT/DnrJ/EryC1/StrS family aminotransferase [Vibrio cholerae]TXY87208.1 DegT/DnrJ/EryC1/StrS family aminotransferase [Vibrio cholerae]BCN22186.1 putative transaminase [Vibrio cholerae]GIC16435.1 UDP-4-amino-4, 6-dideoxy-N-acetyl-beta-L-altrosamine transaminase [Vibrio cholerae]
MIKLSQPKIPESAIEKVADILRSGQLVHGEECNLFEQELAEFLGVKHALVVSNGTAALHLALLALNIGPGDAVIVPDFTFTATANIVEMVGAKAIIVDVDKASYNLDPQKLRECINSWEGPETLKAIMPVLEFGNPTHLNTYRDIAKHHNLFMIEDAACALGASDVGTMVGTAAEFGCFSFHPRKTLTTGEGGAVVTNDTELYNKVALLRSHGMQRTETGVVFKCTGLNYRLTNFQGAIGRAILPELNNWIDKRIELANQYTELLVPLVDEGKLTLPVIVKGHSIQTYMIVLADNFDRSNIIEILKSKDVESNLGAQSMSALGLFNHPNNTKQNYPEGLRLYKHGLALPLYEGMNSDDVLFVVNALTEALSYA